MKNFFSLFVLIFLGLQLSAQTNTTALEDAAELIDILNAKYTGISDPEARREQFIKDTEKLILIIKRNLPRGAVNFVDPDAAIIAQNDLANLYIQKKHLLERITYSKVDNAAAVGAITDEINDASSNLNEQLISDQRHNLQAIRDYLLSVNAVVQNRNLVSIIGVYLTKFEPINRYTSLNALAINDPVASYTNKSAGGMLFGSLSEQALLEGLTNLIVDRLKDEITVVFIRNMQKMISDNKDKDMLHVNDPTNNERAALTELLVLFPKTMDYIAKLERLESYSLLIENLRSKVKSDLEDLLTNTPQLLRRNPYHHLIERYPELVALQDILPLVNDIRKSKDASDFFMKLDHNRSIMNLANSDNNTIRNVGQILQLTAFCVKQLMVKQNGIYVFANKDFFKQYLRDPNFSIVFVGLLWQKALLDNMVININTGANIPIEPLTRLVTNFNDFLTVTDSFLNRAQPFIEKADEIFQLGNELKSKVNSDNKPLPKDYAIYFEKIIILLDTSVVLVQQLIPLALPVTAVTVTPNFALPIPITLNVPATILTSSIISKYHEITNILLKADTIYLGLSNKEYITATIKTFDLLYSFLERGNQIEDAEKIRVSKIQKYIVLLCNLEKASTADDVKKALAAVADPPGSSSKKKESRWSIAVQTYFGVNVGQEWVQHKAEHLINQQGGDSTISAYKDGKAHLGISVPVGLSISCGLGSKPKRMSSLSLFVQIIDIGALATFRLNDDKTSVTPNYTFRTVLSPGVSLHYGLPSVPISLGFGYAFAPQLRTISPNGDPQYDYKD